MLNVTNFRLRVENQKDTAVEGTVRIFLLPVKDEANENFSFDSSRNLAIQVDQFVCKCKNHKSNFMHLNE